MKHLAFNGASPVVSTSLLRSYTLIFFFLFMITSEWYQVLVPDFSAYACQASTPRKSSHFGSDANNKGTAQSSSLKDMLESNAVLQ